MSHDRRAGRDRRQNTAPYQGKERRGHPDRRHAATNSTQAQQPGGLLRFGLVALILFLSISVNLPESMLVRLSLDPNILYASLIAVALSGLVIHKHIAVVTLVILLCIGANLPDGIANQFNINRDYLMAALIGIVILPLVKGWFE